MKLYYVFINNMFHLTRRNCMPLLKHWYSKTLSYSTGISVDKKRAKVVFPDNIQNDWIGPADPDSNLRQMKFYIPPDETPAEKEYRKLREELQEWNHEFWAKHNQNFQQQKELFIEGKMSHITKTGLQSEPAMNAAVAQHMSEFYRKFLDDNYKLHRDYNREWYRKNISILWPAAKVYFQRLFLRRRRKRS